MNQVATSPIRAEKMATTVRANVHALSHDLPLIGHEQDEEQERGARETLDDT